MSNGARRGVVVPCAAASCHQLAWMDYAGEQEMEVEALQAILMDDLVEYEGNLPGGWVATGSTYKVVIDPAEEGDEEPEYPVKAELLFAHTPNYPEDPPSIKLRSVTGLSDADLAEATNVLNQQIEANLGMAMIYTLIGAAKEWLQERAGSGPSVDPEAQRKKEQDEMERKRAEARAHGTAVTQENFAAWKAKFDAEQAALKAKLVEAGKDDDKARRLTGKQFFVRQAAIGEGDNLGDAVSEDGEDVDYAAEAAAAAAEDDDDDEDYDPDDEDALDYEDDDDEGMLDNL